MLWRNAQRQCLKVFCAYAEAAKAKNVLLSYSVIGRALVSTVCFALYCHCLCFCAVFLSSVNVLLIFSVT